jgi:uncharacterized protein YcgI (DUF1989 family)
MVKCFVTYDSPTTNLEHTPALEYILQEFTTHSMINLCKKVKVDHYHHLYYFLKWLNSGNYFWTQGAEMVYISQLYMKIKFMFWRPL